MVKAEGVDIADVQGSRDHRRIAIDQVGVRGLRYPITVLDREHRRQDVHASISMSVNLPPEFKGTHMSRFVEVLNEHRGEVTLRTLPEILGDLTRRLESQSARMEIEFDYFLERRAPVTGLTGLMDYRCAFTGEINEDGKDFILAAEVPVTSLCPCSKEISDYGAHNQRGVVSIQIRSTDDDAGEPQIVWIEELIATAERAASAPLYPLLKRLDERHVTMQAYDNPVFVEDIVRNVAVELQANERVRWFEVTAVNQESIHNHDAFACISWSRT